MNLFCGFRIVRLLGSGGMGEVYLAEHPRLPRRDALKILSSAVSADNDVPEPFTREVDIAAALSHPYIVAGHFLGVADDRQPATGLSWQLRFAHAGLRALETRTINDVRQF